MEKTDDREQRAEDRVKGSEPGGEETWKQIDWETEERKLKIESWQGNETKQ